MHFSSSSEEETKTWASEFIRNHEADLLSGALVITLEGEMGAGKTQFAKGVAGALGVTGIVVSPTYVLTREYQGDYGKLIHIDCWRTPEITMEQLDLETYLQPGTVVIIEWPQPLLEKLQIRDDIALFSFKITHGKTEDSREITQQ
jgi:tRNA threonylcarbamoyladenosine biosynthesis protein TsaE